MSVLKEFREFAIKGNLIDMAVGIILGAAFGKIVTSFVSDLIMPPLGMLMGRVDFKDLKLTLQPGHPAAPGSPAVQEVAIRYGLFLNNIIDFLIVAIAIFLVIKQINRLREMTARKEEIAPTTKDCPYCLSKIPIAATRCPQCTSDLK